MKFVKTTRDKIIKKYKNKSSLYPYFFEDELSEEMSSKFIVDDSYDDKHVQWYFIVEDSIIYGICAIASKKEEDWIKFIEISEHYTGQGLGSAAIGTLLDKTDKSIKLFPRNADLGNKFYKSLGFKWIDDDIMECK